MKPSATFGLMVAGGGAVAPFAQSRCLRSLQSLATDGSSPTTGVAVVVVRVGCLASGTGIPLAHDIGIF